MPCLTIILIHTLVAVMSIFAAPADPLPPAPPSPSAATMNTDLSDTCGKHFKPEFTTYSVGAEDAKPQDAPWLTVVTVENERRIVAWCAGSLLTATHVLTSSDCGVDDLAIDPQLQFRVIIGDQAHNEHATEGRHIYNVTKRTPLRKSGENTEICGLTILELDTPIAFNENTIEPICVDDHHLSPAGHAVVTGWTAWGTSISGDSPKLIKVSQVDII